MKSTEKEITEITNSIVESLERPLIQDRTKLKWLQQRKAILSGSEIKAKYL